MMRTSVGLGLVVCVALTGGCNRGDSADEAGSAKQMEVCDAVYHSVDDSVDEALFQEFDVSASPRSIDAVLEEQAAHFAADPFAMVFQSMGASKPEEGAWAVVAAEPSFTCQVALSSVGSRGARIAQLMPDGSTREKVVSYEPDESDAY